MYQAKRRIRKDSEKNSENGEYSEEGEFSEEALRKEDEIEKLEKEYDKAVLNASIVRKLIGTFKAYSQRLSKADKNMDVPETGLSQLVAGILNRVVADTDKKAMATVNERNKKSQKSTYEKETIFDPDEARRDLIQEGYHEAGKELGAMILRGRITEEGSVIDLFGIQRMSEEIDSELKEHELLKKASAGINADDEERIRNSIHANLEQLEVDLKRAGETEALFTAGAYKKAIEKGWALSDLDMFAELSKYAERDDVQKRNTGKWLKDILDREIKSEADRHKALEDIEMQLADAPALPEGLTELVADSLSYQLQMGEEVHLENRQKIVPDIMDDLNAEDELNFDDEMFEDFEADMIAEAKKPEIKAKEENKEEKKKRSKSIKK